MELELEGVTNSWGRSRPGLRLGEPHRRKLSFQCTSDDFIIFFILTTYQNIVKTELSSSAGLSIRPV